MRSAIFEKSIGKINFWEHPIFVSEGIKKRLCREFGGVELTLMKVNKSNNDERIREMVVILVCLDCIRHWNEG